MNTLPMIRSANRLLGRVAPDAAAGIARRLLMRPRRHGLPPHEAAALADAEPVTFRFGLGGLRWGTQGPRVLALHGWEGRPTQFATLVPPLLARGYQVIALDAPAHGRSPGEEAHPVAFAQAVVEAASELRGVDAFIGHSMGGGAGLYALALGLRVEAMVTIAAPAALRAVLERFAGAIALPAPATERFIATVGRHAGVPADEVDAALRDVRPARALVVHDTDDREVPAADAERLAAALPEAELMLTRGLGHRRILRDPALAEAVAAFIGRGTTPARAS